VSPPTKLGLGLVVTATAGMLFFLAVRGMLPNAFSRDENDRVATVSALAGAATIFLASALFAEVGY
jgi:zinc transporter ZupT